jgi:hypothetical protein
MDLLFTIEDLLFGSPCDGTAPVERAKLAASAFKS